MMRSIRSIRALSAACLLMLGFAGAPVLAQEQSSAEVGSPEQEQPSNVPPPVQRGQMGSMITPIEALPFRSDTERRRYKSLVDELRCTVCQNESLSASTAPLARDIRMQVFDMLQEGRTDFEIRSFMVDRYGDFVLYRPPFASHTLLLWVGPGLLLLIGLMTAFFVIRKRRQAL